MKTMPTNETAADKIHGQIRAMLSRSDEYQKEAESEKDFSNGEIHARVSAVLRELDRLATAFIEEER